ncbi:MAG: hypothetical protein FWE59_05120, partial [Oscillospiraceae bacterium]|nr:hypothetical protein [Oscillospiraceae bacterium]
ENEKELTRQQMLKEQSEHFTQRLAEAYAKQLEAINAIRTKEFPTSVPSRDEHADKATQDISTSVQAALDHGQQTADVSSSKALPPSGQAPPVQSSPVQSPSRSATHTAAHTAAHTAQFSPQPAVPPSPQLVREPQTSFEITLKGNGSNTFVSDDMEDDMASRPKFDFPDLQRQFGKQYSAQVK